MSSVADSLLARLAGQEADATGASVSALAASAPAHEAAAQKASEFQIDAILQRINGLKESAVSQPTLAAAATAPGVNGGVNNGASGFVPMEPASFRAAGLTESDVEAIILKYLLNRGEATGRDTADHVKLPFALVDELLRRLKLEQLIAYRSAATMNDFVYQLTDLGRERARRFYDHCTYHGSAPVVLADYITAVKAQSLENQYPTEEDLKRGFSDLLVSGHMLRRLGPAINSGRGMFLFGGPGNGKTSIAERITRCFGQTIWIPRALGIDGEIMRLFDPNHHEEMPLAKGEGLLDQSKIDTRWVRIRRPTIVVGGELTMDNLEVTLNTSTKISEAPVQLKSNCGTLVIDDFGRQKMRVDELLNRWIVPLEKRYDFLNLPNGKKIQVPFDQLIVFSTNLEPRDLVDDAFLRRIPYKIEVVGPTEEEFCNLMRLMAPKLGFEYREPPVAYLIEKHYRAVQRPFRACQPRDLLQQVKNYCVYRKLPLEMTNEYFDYAVENYFAVM